METIVLLGSICFIVPFLLGSIPFGLIISRIFYHTDIREHGSGNIGTTNAIRAIGKPGGFIVFALDFGKGFLSAFVAFWACEAFAAASASPLLTADYLQVMLALSMLGCVLGHVFSPWLRFRGGKGIAVAIGCMFPVFGIVIAMVEIAVFVLVVVLTRYVSAGSVAAALLFFVLSWVSFSGNIMAASLCAACAMVVIWAHRGNIGRLIAGTERKIGRKS